MGFGVWGLGFGVWGLRFGVWASGFGVWGLGLRVEGLRAEGFRFQVSGFRFWDWVLWLRVYRRHVPRPVTPHDSLCERERIFIELMTSDRKQKASRNE